MLLFFLLTVSVMDIVFSLPYFCLFKGLLAIKDQALTGLGFYTKNIAKTTLYCKFFILLLLFLFLYCNTDTVYCLDEKTAKNLAEASINNNVNINNTNVNLPGSVFKTLGVTGGMTATAAILKTSALPPLIKVGFLAAGQVA